LPGSPLPDDAATLRLTLPPDASAVETARAAVLRHVGPHALCARTTFAVEVVLEEVLMNVAMHAYRDGEPVPTELEVWIEDDDIVLRFDDAGVAFDPLQAPPPRQRTDLAHAEPGGLGLAMVRRRARRIDYERVEGRNRLTVAVHRG
jgi:serine/threonine-protein kinase RsbW